MQIPNHVQDLINLGAPQQIAEKLGSDSDKSLAFDGSVFVVSGYIGLEPFEQTFSDMNMAIAHYQSIKIA